MFQEMIDNIREEVAMYIMKAHVQSNLERQAVAEGQAVDTKNEAGGKKPLVRAEEQRIGRNDPCPCGSGKKFKQCHGQGM
ncbi:preprotein translocase subunit SecA [compost metagenome]